MKKLFLAAVISIVLSGAGLAFRAAAGPTAATSGGVPEISANVSLASLVALSDGHL